MDKTNKLLHLFVCLLIVVLTLFLINPIFIPDESFNGFSGEGNDTIIICSATGDMKALEVGVASYAGKEGIPIILTSQTIPFPLNEWFSLFKDRANIKKVILIGPVSPWQVFSLKLLNLNVERIDGPTKAEILTEMAEKTYKSQDAVIITASDPSASLLGAYMDVPVFVVAETGNYTSSDTLEPEYEGYISDNNIKRVIVVGTVSQGIIDNLNSKDIQLEEIRGNDNFQTSVLVSDRIREILGQRNVEVKTAYAGFYGELPSIIPLAVHYNSIILTDPTIHMDKALDYLTTAGIDDVIITRNGPADYLQMEEPDFVSSSFIDRLHAAGINTFSLTNFRTINEATGLYETKMMAAELLHGTGGLWGGAGLDPSLTLLDSVRTGITEYPPILDTILKGGNWGTSTGSQLTVKQIGLNEWYYQWKGIHPYIWQRINDDDWYCYSGTQYSWHWVHANKTDNDTYTNNTHDTWTVEYLSDNKVYTRVYWVKKGNLWEEIHSEAYFNWKKEFNLWICYQNGVNESFTMFPTVFLNRF
jgi:hypothetical protein